jgi:hypothetical protein
MVGQPGALECSKLDYISRKINWWNWYHTPGAKYSCAPEGTTR